MEFHLAQVNIAVAKYAYEDPRFAGFVDNLSRVYELAESTPGFVWRHVTVNNYEEAKALYGEANLIFNMSVWESVEALRQFVYEHEHAGILRQRAEWFTRTQGASFALWWHPAGYIPSIVESKWRIDTLAKAGPTENAFTFREIFDPPGCERLSRQSTA